MNIVDFAQLLTALAAVGGFLIAIYNALGIRHVDRGVQKVEHSTNSIKDELVAEVRKASHALGLKEGLRQYKNGRQRKPKPKKPHRT